MIVRNLKDYCQEPRYGMYHPSDAACGAYATHLADGQPVCATHARRSTLEGKEVVMRPSQQHCEQQGKS